MIDERNQIVIHSQLEPLTNHILAYPVGDQCLIPLLNGYILRLFAYFI